MFKDLIKKVTKRLSRRKKKLADKTKVTYWINSILGKGENLLVQIGSNDGKTGDPLFEIFKKNNKWRGIFVEPIPYLFEKLKKNYNNDDRFIFENIAISENDSLAFYWVEPRVKDKYPDLPFWFDQLGSFDRSHIEKHLDGKLSSFIREMQVQTSTLGELFEKYKITSIDMLHIDVEGHDWKVLSQLDLSKYKPKIILFEYHHLHQDEIENAVSFLYPYYRVYQAGIDMFCLLKSIGISNDLSKIFKVIDPR